MNTRAVIGVSLGLNVILAIAAIVLAVKLAGPRPATLTPAEGSAVQVVTQAVPTGVPGQVKVEKPAEGFDWRLVESEDYKKYIVNLRSIGCPEETIRDIITADVNKL